MNTTLHFGKHKGSDLKDVPLKYLAWLLTKYEGSSLSREAIESEAIKRGCEKRNGNWGIAIPVVTYSPGEMIPNTDLFADPWDDMGPSWSMTGSELEDYLERYD